jgi:hypothetical protein
VLIHGNFECRSNARPYLAWLGTVDEDVHIRSAEHIPIARAIEKFRKLQRFQRVKAIQVAMEAVLLGRLFGRRTAGHGDVTELSVIL